MTRQPLPLSGLARAGFDDFEQARTALSRFSAASGVDPEALLAALSVAADPDDALVSLERLHDRAPAEVRRLLDASDTAERTARLLGA